jgi:hypothetical protein
MRESVPTTREQSFLSFKQMLLFVRKREIGTDDIRALGMLDLDFIVYCSNTQPTSTSLLWNLSIEMPEQVQPHFF